MVEIQARIENLRYDARMCAPLDRFRSVDVLSAFRKPAFALEYKGIVYAVSHWVSPKRTRSFPYARVYDTINCTPRVTVIPFCKDEGRDGDRDFVQWDSVSLMSLLGVYVVLAYYNTARKSPRYKGKITGQEFDYDYVLSRFDELRNYKSDALHWNLTELTSNLPNVAVKAKQAYKRISRETGVILHGDSGFDERIETLQRDANAFRRESRTLAEAAQSREVQTVQPKESTRGDKAKITIVNYLGGTYYFTLDEFRLAGDRVLLIEKKHSAKRRLPSIAEIKDALVKMMLFTNLRDVHVEGRPFQPVGVIGMTSPLIDSRCESTCDAEYRSSFAQRNRLTTAETQTLTELFDEAIRNGFVAYIERSDSAPSHVIL